MLIPGSTEFWNQNRAKKGEPELPPMMMLGGPDPEAPSPQAGQPPQSLWESIMNPMTLAGLSILGSPTRDVGQGMQAGLLAQQRLDKRQDQQRELMDPMRDLERRHKEALIEKLQREAMESGTTYGKSGSIFQGADGKFYSIQFGGDGSRKILPLEVPGAGPSGPGPMPPQSQDIPQEGAGRFAAPGIGSATPPPVQLTPSRGVDVVGDQMYDKATGAPVRHVGGNLAEAERQKSLGKGQAEGQLALPKAATALKQYQEQDKIVGETIDRAISQSDGWTTGLTGAAASVIPGTAAHNLNNTLNTIKANLGFDKLQAMRDASPTGGALGQVSEMENRLLQSVWGSVEQSQTQEQLVENLSRIKAIREQYAIFKQQAYEQDVARFGVNNVPNPDGGQPQPAPAAPGQQQRPDPLGLFGGS